MKNLLKISIFIFFLNSFSQEKKVAKVLESYTVENSHFLKVKFEGNLYEMRVIQEKWLDAPISINSSQYNRYIDNSYYNRKLSSKKYFIVKDVDNYMNKYIIEYWSYDNGKVLILIQKTKISTTFN